LPTTHLSRYPLRRATTTKRRNVQHQIGLHRAKYCDQKYRRCYRSCSLAQFLSSHLKRQYCGGQLFDLESTHAVAPQGGLSLSAPDCGPRPEVPPLLLSLL
jgi:hypothetical protein